MAWTRSPRGRRRGRRFFRRRRPFSQRTPREQGAGKWERSFFNFGLSQSIPVGTLTQQRNSILCISGQSLLAPLLAAGTQAQAVGLVMSQPLKGYDVLAIQYDLNVLMSPGRTDATGNLDVYDRTVQIGHALYSDRVAQDGVSPVSIPPYDTSQWPVYQGATSTVRDDNEYALRTHHHWASLLSMAQTNSGTAIGGADGQVFRAHRVRRKLANRFTDNFGLFFNFWNATLATNSISAGSSVEWFVTGSLWYRLKW